MASLFFLIHISLHISFIITAIFPLQEETARDLLPFDSYRTLSESQKKHNHLVTPVPAAASQAGADTTRPSLSAAFNLAFADQTYPYTAAVLLLLLLIVLSLYLLWCCCSCVFTGSAVVLPPCSFFLEFLHWRFQCQGLEKEVFK